MFNFTGRYGSAKGMVAVPDLIGLTPSEAQTALASVGLKLGTTTPENTGILGYSNKIKSQEISASTLVDYDSEISFTYYLYTVSVVSTSDTGCVVTSTDYPYTCSGYTQYVSPVQNRSGTITKTYSDGSTQTTTYPCSPAYPTPYTVGNSSTCGYVAPSCTPSTQDVWSGVCHTYGYENGLRVYTSSSCSQTSDPISRCCINQLSTSYGTWGTCVCKQRSRTNYSPYYYCGTYYPNPWTETGSCSLWGPGCASIAV